MGSFRLQPRIPGGLTLVFFFSLNPLAFSRALLRSNEGPVGIRYHGFYLPYRVTALMFREPWKCTSQTGPS